MRHILHAEYIISDLENTGLRNTGNQLHKTQEMVNFSPLQWSRTEWTNYIPVST